MNPDQPEEYKVIDLIKMAKVRLKPPIFENLLDQGEQVAMQIQNDVRLVYCPSTIVPRVSC